MNEIKLKDESAMNGLFDEIKTLVIHSRNHIVTEINSTLLQTYWEIGKVNQLLAQYEQMKKLFKTFSSGGKGLNLRPLFGRQGRFF